MSHLQYVIMVSDSCKPVILKKKLLIEINHAAAEVKYRATYRSSIDGEQIDRLRPAPNIKRPKVTKRDTVFLNRTAKGLGRCTD